MEKSWFEERIGRKVIRTNGYDGREVEFTIDEKNAGYLWQFTLKGFTYRESVGVLIAQTATDDNWLEAAKPTLRVHRKPFVECESCSA